MHPLHFKYCTSITGRHLQTLVGQRSSVESFLVGGFQAQSRVAVLLGLLEAAQLQQADGSVGGSASL